MAEDRLLRLKSVYGDRLYVELQRPKGYDRAIEAATVDLAYRHELPLVATNEAFFPAREDYDAHDALIAIAEGSVIGDDNRRRLTPDNYLKSQAEMSALFSDLPEAIDPASASGPSCVPTRGQHVVLFATRLGSVRAGRDAEHVTTVARPAKGKSP